MARKMKSIRWIRDMDEDQQLEFYQVARGMSAANVKSMCLRTIEASKTKRTTKGTEWDWQPLGVLQTRGYDVETIQREAKPDHKDVCPIYGWDLYRVAWAKGSSGEERVVKAGMSIQNKRKTKALKRRRTDPTSEDDASEFSPEPSSDESEEAPRKGKGAIAKAKGKAKPLKDDKGKKKVRADADKALEKIAKTLDALRAECRHTHIMDVESPIIDPVRALLAELSDLEKAAQKVKNIGVDDGSLAMASAFDHKGCKAAKDKLKKRLAKLAR